MRWRRSGGRKVRTPLYLQFEATECAAACLGILLAYFGRWVPLEELRRACGVSRDACSAADVVDAAREYGLRLTGRRMEPRRIERPDMPLPAILFWELDHFVVLEGASRSTASQPSPPPNIYEVDAVSLLVEVGKARGVRGVEADRHDLLRRRPGQCLHHRVVRAVGGEHAGADRGRGFSSEPYGATMSMGRFEPSLNGMSGLVSTDLMHESPAAMVDANGQFTFVRTWAQVPS